MTSYVPKTIVARCKTQFRCLASFSSLTRTSTCSDSNNFVTIYATTSNKIYNAKPSASELPNVYNRSLLEFAPATQILQQKGGTQHDGTDLEDVIQAMSRNSRRPKKANKGSRPCSRAGRRKRKAQIGNRSR